MDETFEENIKNEEGPELRSGYLDGKFLVAEFYVRQYDDDGTILIFQVQMIGNKLIVSNKKTPYKGLQLPFVALSANPFPGSIEGLSSIDIGKNMQRLFNELFNQFLDGVSYRMFPPLVREPGTNFTKRPKWSLGAIWDVTNPQGLRPLIENPGVMPDLPPLMAAVSAKIRETLNAHDISQGFQSQEYEKATATSLRAQGANKRALPIRRQYGLAVVEIAQMFLSLNQQYHPQAELFVLPVIVDVPSLTAITDPESDKQDALLLLTQAQQSPLYQSPVGLTKIRNMTQDVVELFKKIDIEKYVITEEELQSDMNAQRELQAATLEKQAAQEQLEAASQGGQ